MSALNKFTLLVFAIIILGGCEDMLNVEPQTFSSASNYYENEEQIIRGVNAAYGNLQTIFSSSTDYWAMAEMRSDNTSFQFNASDRGELQMENLDEFLITASNNDIGAVWSNIYSGIQQTNTILNRIEEVNFSDENVKNNVEGEMRFLRAFHYFNLVRLFGGVPIVLEETESPDDSFSERSSVEDVYSQIISDASTAVDLLPESYSGSDVGRATRGAALTLLGEVYLTRENYSETISTLEEVTTLSYQLLSSYSNVFDPDNKNHSESIFEVQYSAGVDGEASNYIYRFAPHNSGSDIVGFNDLAHNFAGYNIPTHDMVNAYEEGDERKDASIAFYVNPDNAQHDVAIGDSIPFINKYNHEFEQRGETNDNWPIYRYSYVLLMLAEAKNEEGQTQEAHSHLNEVRNRAGLSSLSSLSQTEFREAVQQEMRVELAFENHRWFNLLRMDDTIEIMTEHGEEEKDMKSNVSESAYNIQEYKLLYPIPEREVRLNNIEQNPGW